MSNPNDLVEGIKKTVAQVSELEHPEQSDQAAALVVELQQKLSLYVQRTPTGTLDAEMLRSVLATVLGTKTRAQHAHAEVASSLDAVKLGKSAVHAYQGENAEPLDMQ